MDSAPANPASALNRELVALLRAVTARERERDARLDAKLAELDDRRREYERVHRLITGGAARREARLRALETMVEAMAAERSRAMTPRPLDIPDRPRPDPPVVELGDRDSNGRD